MSTASLSLTTHRRFLARQPIFDAAGKVWGHALLHRPASEAEQADLRDADASTLAVASSLLVLPDHSFRESRFLVHATPAFLEEGYADGLASERMILSVTPAMLRAPGAGPRLQAMRDRGAAISLSLDPREGLDLERLDQVQMLSMPSDAIATTRQWPWRWLKELQKRRLLITRIETHEQADAARDVGASCFQGFFYQRPRTYSLAALPPAVVSRFALLQMLEQERCHLGEIAREVETDPGIAFRLLRMANSAEYARGRAVESVRQAVGLLGTTQLKSLLRLIVVTDLRHPEDSMELAFTAAQRARFLDLAAHYSGRGELAEQVYILGLFSTLEALLHRRYEDILRDLPLSLAVRDALAAGAGPLAPWLTLALEAERGNGMALDAAGMALGLSLTVVGSCAVESMRWAATIHAAA